MITDGELDQWRRQGWLTLRQVLDADAVTRIVSWVDVVEGWASNGGPGLHHFEQTAGGPRIARSEDFAPHHAQLDALLRTGLIPDALSVVLGQPVTLFKEKINYKHPGGAGFAPHQDATAYRFVDHHVSCMVPLDPATEASGCLYFAPIVQPPVLANTDGRIEAEWVARAQWQAAEVEPGDLVLFDSYTPHHSSSNTSARSRRALYVTYNAAAAGDFRTSYYHDKAALLDAVDSADTNDSGGTGRGRVRISVNDDFLGVPVGRP